jgi:sugar/nucleoside kinase (ribokinase family)
LPAPGGYVEVAEERIQLGGEASNTANALTAWGDEVLLTGNALGEGVEGELLRRLLAERDLRPSEAGPSPDGGGRTPVCDIYLTPDGERTMFGLGFSSMEPQVSRETLPLAPDVWFTAEPNMERASRQAVRLAQEAGMKTYLMDFIRPDDTVGPGVFWQSSTDWAGHRGNLQRNVQWVAEFVGRTGAFAILSDGPNGLVAGGPNHPPRHYPPFPAPKVVDTTGAGDIFRAGMLHGLSRDWPLERCLAFAAAAGSLECGFLGATTGVPTVAEIEALIARHPEIEGHY